MIRVHVTTSENFNKFFDGVDKDVENALRQTIYNLGDTAKQRIIAKGSQYGWTSTINPGGRTTGYLMSSVGFVMQGYGSYSLHNYNEIRRATAQKARRNFKEIYERPDGSTGIRNRRLKRRSRVNPRRRILVNRKPNRSSSDLPQIPTSPFELILFVQASYGAAVELGGQHARPHPYFISTANKMGEQAEAYLVREMAYTGIFSSNYKPGSAKVNFTQHKNI